MTVWELKATMSRFRLDHGTGHSWTRQRWARKQQKDDRTAGESRWRAWNGKKMRSDGHAFSLISISGGLKFSPEFPKREATYPQLVLHFIRLAVGSSMQIAMAVDFQIRSYPKASLYILHSSHQCGKHNQR
ncbi:unnamed protein product [Nezara viridula]|uniref:Uncharacterized protein n=1 Tax=Nezara viridula TaxID=85310 RepID=A0A9P0DYA2_NEZVI|nr:unnamed protein product [Nezara viridula]